MFLGSKTSQSLRDIRFFLDRFTTSLTGMNLSFVGRNAFVRGAANADRRSV